MRKQSEATIPPRGRIRAAFLAVLLLLPLPARAATIASEAFDYAAGGPLTGSGGTGWAGPWSGGNVVISSGGLPCPSGPLLTGGNAAQLSIPTAFAQTGVTRHLASPLGGSASEIWISFLVRPDGTSVADYMGLVVGSAPAESVYAGCQGTEFWVSTAGAFFPTFSVPGAASGQTTFLVLRIGFSPTVEDTVTLYVDPTPGLALPDVVAAGTKSDVDLGSFTRVEVVGGRALNPNLAVLDEIRIGDSYPDVAPAGSCPAFAGDTLFVDCFDDEILAQTPSDWSVSPGAGGVVVKLDGSTQVLSDGTVGGAPVTTGDSTWTDVSVAQRFRSVSGGIDHAGLIARYADDGNMVYGGIVTATTAEIWNRIGGTWTQIGGTWTIPDVSGGWHTQELRVAGDRASLYIDGVFVGDATVMPGAPSAGQAGFWSQYGSREGYRDDHVVRQSRLVAGTVFEDADFAGTASAYDGGLADAPLPSVEVEAYDGADLHVASTTTSVDGTFGLVLHDGAYKVRARSATIGDIDSPPAGGLNASVPGTWPYPLPEMTWGSGSALYGGRSPTTDDTDTGDDAGPGDTWVPVTVMGGDVSGVDLGFAFNLIVNTADDGLADAVRSDQGSLRQFLKNANGIGAAGGTTASTSAFRMQVPPSGGGGADSLWQVTVVAALPALTDDGTVLDGSSQTSVLDRNSLGPEIGVFGDGLAADGLRIMGSGCEVRGLVISGFAGSSQAAVLLFGAGATGNTIEDNYLGTDHTGTGAVANDYGVRITASASSNVVAGNTIAFQTADGIRMQSAGSVGNRLSANVIRASGGLAIDLQADGVTPNDPGDSDSGPNELLNFPVLSRVVVSGGTTTIEGTLDSHPNTLFDLEFFSCSAPDPSGHGEAEVFLGSRSVATDGTGTAFFSETLPLAIAVTDVITATATDPAGNTSEASAAQPTEKLAIVKRAFLADGTPVAPGSTVPTGTLVRFLLYINNPGGLVSDASLQDMLDPGFAYVAGSLKYDASVSSCGGVDCSPAEESVIFAAVDAGTSGTDPVDGDVVSVTGAAIDVGDQNAPNAALDLPGGRVWALAFTVRVN